MSTESRKAAIQQVNSLVQGLDDDQKTWGNIDKALTEIATLLKATEDNFLNICHEVEGGGRIL